MAQDKSAPCNSLMMKQVDTSDNNSSNSNSDSDYLGKEKNSRDTWGRKAEYILSNMGYSIGLSNVWRFPYVCMRNGGGAFVIPFVVSLVLCGLPMFFLEVAVGQFLGKSSFHAWNMCALFKGIGISMNILNFYFGTYYAIIVAWTLVYLGHSFRSPLPWTLCGEWWNTPACFTPENRTAENLAGGMALAANSSSVLANGSWANSTVALKPISAPEEFWLHNVLEISPGLTHLNGSPLPLLLAFVGGYLLVFIAVIKGIRSSGKVVYVTATLPYVLLLVILIKGVTLDGAGSGLLYYFKPSFSKLLTFQTWVESIIQIFYSLGPGWGVILTMASYNKFNNNCLKDSVFLAFVCEGTSIFGGLAIFSVLGHMAHKSNVTIESFATSGPGLAFIVYPEAISYLPLPQLWGFFFFLMLFSLGFDSEFASVETMTTTIVDLWPKVMTKHRTLCVGGVSLVYMLTGFVLTTRGGIYVFQLADWYIAAFTITIQAALECIVVSWIYGADRFGKDIELMIGRRPPAFFYYAWKFVTPGLLMLLFFFTLFTYTPPSYNGYHFTQGAQIGGWIYSILPFIVFLVFTIYQLTGPRGSVWQRIKVLCVPTPVWKPSPPELQEKYLAQYGTAQVEHHPPTPCV